jgi:hypothetical protein
MPDPIREEESQHSTQLDLRARTESAIRRQANLIGFDTPTDYLTQTIAATLVSNGENNIVITQDGRPHPQGQCSRFEWRATGGLRGLLCTTLRRQSES